MAEQPPFELNQYAARTLRTLDRLRSVGIEPSAVMMCAMPGMDVVEQPNVTFCGVPVVWSQRPGVHLMIDVS